MPFSSICFATGNSAFPIVSAISLFIYNATGPSSVAIATARTRLDMLVSRRERDRAV